MSLTGKIIYSPDWWMHDSFDEASIQTLRIANLSNDLSLRIINKGNYKILELRDLTNVSYPEIRNALLRARVAFFSFEVSLTPKSLFFNLSQYWVGMGNGLFLRGALEEVNDFVKCLESVVDVKLKSFWQTL